MLGDDSSSRHYYRDQGWYYQHEGSLSTVIPIIEQVGKLVVQGPKTTARNYDTDDVWFDSIQLLTYGLSPFNLSGGQSWK